MENYNYYFKDITEEQRNIVKLVANDVDKRLRDRFYREIRKRGESNFYLSYSGGLDSYLIFWWMKNRYDLGWKIPVVSSLNFLQFDSIRDRMYADADIIIYPKWNIEDVKEKYGIPCFSKPIDTTIHRYQRGSRQDYLLSRNIYGIGTQRFKLNKKAGSLLLNGKLHKISPYCCIKTKEEPLREYALKTGKKPIMGVRKQESSLRMSRYTSCIQENGSFTPLYDLTDFEEICFYDYFQVPKVYPYTKAEFTYTFEDFSSSGRLLRQGCRSGCLGCPYSALNKGIMRETEYMSFAQLKYVLAVFEESYRILEVYDDVENALKQKMK